jgi:tyrosine-protein kinase Etk/Wzc
MNKMPGQQAHAFESSEITLSAIIHEILDHRWLILIVTLFCCGIGAFYAVRQIPQYQSDVLLQVGSPQSSMGQAAAGAQSFTFRSPMGDATSTQIALMQSRFILEPVIRTLGLDVGVTLKKTGFWSRLTSFKKKTIKVSLFQVPRKQMNQSFDLVLDKPNHLRVFDSMRQLVLEGAVGARLTNADHSMRLQVDAVSAPIGTVFSLVRHSDLPIVKSLAGQLQISEAGGKTRQSTGILQVSLTGSDPDRIMQILNAVATVVRDKDAHRKSQEAAQTLAFLFHQLPITKGQLEEAESALNRYRATSGKIDTKAQIQFLLGQLTSLDTKLSELGIHKIDLLQHYTTDHPLLIALDTQTKALQSQRAELEKAIKKLPASDQITINLMRDVGVKKTLYLILLSKIQELEVVKAGTISSVHILAYASRPDAPLRGKTPQIYLASILFGLLISAGIIVIRRLLSPRVDDPHWGERHFNLANLAIIPYCKEQTDHTVQFKNRAIAELPLLARDNPRNLSVESLRSLRTSLQVTLACASNNRIAILGISPGVGKSFVSANLAYLMAAGGKRVLLVDGDLRRGTLHQYMSSPATPGLADVLNKTVQLDQALIRGVHPNLDFISRGTYPTDPSELLMGDYFKELMLVLSEQYDAVIIDTAPVLLVTDAVLIGSITATNYLVMGAGAHQPSDIDMVMKRLTGSSVQLHGSIFNFYRMDTVGFSYGKYGQYGKYGKYSKYNTYYYDNVTEKQ